MPTFFAGLLIWSLFATSICLFIRGASEHRDRQKWLDDAQANIQHPSSN